MVGFISESAKEEDCFSGATQPKLKTSTNDSESYKFDFDEYSSDFDAFSLSSVQPFLEFDSIKDWVEEMQDPIREEAIMASGVGLDSGLQNPVVDCSVESIKDMEKSGPVKVVQDNRDEMGRDDSKVSMVNVIGAESDEVKSAENCYDGKNDDGEGKNLHGNESCMGVLVDGNCGKLEGLGCSIEEGLEKVSLVGSAGSLVVSANGMKKTEVASVGDKNGSDSDSDSESGSETSSSSSSASSSSDDSDDDDDDDEEENKEEKSGNIKSENTKQKVDVEEGEIMGSHSEKMISLSEDDDDDCEENDTDLENFEVGEDDEDDGEGDGGLSKGPVMSRNEVKVLPPVPPVNVTLQPCHQISPVGAVLSILGAQVIVEGAEKHSPLSEGSILWIAETRLPLGLVDEIFGPVKTPYYIVRYNSESEVPSGIEIGTVVGFVPEFVDHVLNDKSIYQKGYDASGENDEELFDEAEFSDDEKEAEYRRMLKMSKRGNNNQGQGPGNKKKNKRNLKNREKTWTKDQPPPSQTPTIPQPQANQMQQNVRPPVASFSQGQPSGPSVSRPNFPAGPTAFPQPAQPAGFMLNGSWTNGMPFQQQNMVLPSGFQMNGMPWSQQNPSQAHQMPSVTPTLLQQQQLFSQICQANSAASQQQQLFPQMSQANSAPSQQQQFFSQISQMNSGPAQQPFDLSQLISGSNASQFGPASFAGGPTNSPWPGMLGPNIPNQGQQCLPGASAQFPVYPGHQSSGPQVGQGGNFQPAPSFTENSGVRPQFNHGFSSGSGRGNKPFQQRGRGRGRGGGGQFRGGRGRQQQS